MCYISFNYSSLHRFRQAILGSYMVNAGLRKLRSGLPFSFLSSTAALSHIFTRCRIEPSLTRRETQRISCACGIVSKYRDKSASTTRAKRCERVLQTKYVRSGPAFPQSRQGRPSHCAFRGRLDVHACYGLSTCRRPCATLCLPGFDYFVTSMAAGIATRPGRPVPGQDFHLLEQRAFARHTWTTTVDRIFFTLRCAGANR